MKCFEYWKCRITAACFSFSFIMVVVNVVMGSGISFLFSFLGKFALLGYIKKDIKRIFKNLFNLSL